MNLYPPDIAVLVRRMERERVLFDPPSPPRDLVKRLPTEGVGCRFGLEGTGSFGCGVQAEPGSLLCWGHQRITRRLLGMERSWSSEWAHAVGAVFWRVLRLFSWELGRSRRSLRPGMPLVLLDLETRRNAQLHAHGAKTRAHALHMEELVKEAAADGTITRAERAMLRREAKR